MHFFTKRVERFVFYLMIVFHAPWCSRCLDNRMWSRYLLVVVFLLCSCSSDSTSPGAWGLEPLLDMNDEGARDLAANTTSLDMSDDLTDAGDESERPACAPVVPSACVIVDPDAYGDCGELVGFGFDGTSCVEVIGCPCELGAECHVFDTKTECATICAAEGYCKADALRGATRAAAMCQGFDCGDGLAVCVSAEVDPSKELEVLLPDLGDVECGQGNEQQFPCAVAPGGECQDGDWCCTPSQSFGVFPNEPNHELCATTLLAEVKSMSCYYLD